MTRGKQTREFMEINYFGGTVAISILFDERTRAFISRSKKLFTFWFGVSEGEEKAPRNRRKKTELTKIALDFIYISWHMCDLLALSNDAYVCMFAIGI